MAETAQEKFPRVGVATIVTNVGHNVLIGRSNKPQTKGKWIIPGGGIKPFESIQETSTREIKEETGVEVSNQEMLFVSERLDPPNEHRIVIYVEGKATGGLLRSTFTEDDELSEARWVDPRDLHFYQHEMSEMTIDAFIKYSMVLQAKAAHRAQQIAADQRGKAQN